MNIKLNPLFLKVTLLFVILLTAGAAQAQTQKNLDSLFKSLEKKSAINGCVLVAENGKPIYQKAFGYADFATKRMLDNESVFELASVAKQFTAMAIMQLHQQKKLEYTDNIKKYFPKLPYENITVNNLLHHTSGISEFLGWSGKEIDTTRINYNIDILNALIKNAPALSFKVNDSLSYCNTNYVLLALIVEKVSGLSFASYLDQHIFKPLNMTSTKVYPQRATKQKISNYALGNVYDPVKGRFAVSDSSTANRYQYYFDGASGPYGISSNTTDLLKWDQALYTEKLASKDEQALAYAPAKLNNGKTASFMGLTYGFGWLIPPASGHTGNFYLHTGGYPGYMTIICRYPEKQKTFIVLTNTWNVINIYALGAAIEDILFDQPFGIPEVLPFQKTVVLAPGTLKPLTGNYAFTKAPNIKLKVTEENNQLYVQLTGQVKAEVYPESEVDFFYTIVKAKIKFLKDSGGKVEKMVLYQNGQEMEAGRAQ
jgi:CubicO group peptidase (beta-lactamase class C family)